MNITREKALTYAIYGVPSKECDACHNLVTVILLEENTILFDGRENSYCEDCFDKVNKVLDNMEDKGHIERIYED